MNVPNEPYSTNSYLSLIFNEKEANCPKTRKWPVHGRGLWAVLKENLKSWGRDELGQKH